MTAGFQIWTKEGTQVEGCSGGEDGVWSAEVTIAFKVSVGTQHRDAQNTDGYMHQQKPQKRLGWMYLHVDVVKHRGVGKDEVHKDTFSLTATQVAK